MPGFVDWHPARAISPREGMIMTMSETTTQALRNLLATDASLQDALRSATSAEEATSRLVAAADTAGIRVDGQALGEAVRLARELAASGAEVSDEALENVAGGWVPLANIAGGFREFIYDMLRLS